MSQIYNQLKELISPNMIAKASSFLNLDSYKTSSAVSSIIPGFLGSILHKGDSTELQNTLTEAGKTNILADLPNIFMGNMTEKQTSIGNKFLNNLFGVKKDSFNSVVASQAGIPTASASKLVMMLSPVVAAFLGNKINNNGLNLSGLLSELNSEKNSFLGMIPTGVAGMFGLNSLADLGNSFYKTNRVVVDPIADTGIRNTTTTKSSGGWWKWLLFILLLLLLIFWWRSCTNKNVPVREQVIETRDTVVERVSSAYDNVRDRFVRDSTDRDTTTVRLSNGQTLHAYRNGIEEKMVNYLNSNEYKNASADDVKDKWFNFDNIEFKFGSSTEFTEGSRRQLDNVIAILKNYPDAKIKLGAYTDKVGTEEANLKLSQERANTLKSIFDKAGLKSQVVEAEGYGEQFAKHDEDDSNSERAEDRIMALRFVK